MFHVTSCWSRHDLSLTFFWKKSDLNGLYPDHRRCQSPAGALICYPCPYRENGLYVSLHLDREIYPDSRVTFCSPCPCCFCVHHFAVLEMNNDERVT